MQCKYRECLGNVCNKACNFLDLIRPAVNLAVRFYISYLVLMLAFIKIQDWNAVLFMFENEYQVPFMPASVAAVITVALQIVCPIMIILGYRARIGALILFLMAFISNYFYQPFVENEYWMLILAMLMSYGSDKWSLDCYLCCKEEKSSGKKKK